MEGGRCSTVAKPKLNSTAENDVSSGKGKGKGKGLNLNLVQFWE